MTDHEDEHPAQPNMNWVETLKTNFLFSRPFWWFVAAQGFGCALIWHVINRDNDKLATSVIWAAQGSSFLAGLYWVARDQAKEIMMALAELIRGWKKPPPAA